MSQQPEDRDDLEAAGRRLESEFGRRHPGEPADDQGATAQPRPQPAPDGAQPYQPRPQPMRVRIAPASRPRATFALLGVIGVVYLLSCLLSASLFNPSLGALVFLGAKENSLIAGGELWRLVSATFLHANLVHLFFNGYALYVLGPESERIYGTPRFLALYFLAGVGGSAASYLFSPVPSVGASGAIFGLMGGLGLFFYLNRELLGEAGRAQVQNIIAIGCINLLIGFASPGVIDNFGHLGGLAAGLVAALALAPRFAVDPQLYPPRAVRRFPPWGVGAALALGVALVALAALLPGAT